MLSLLIVVSSVISDTPTCFFLNPSFQSAFMTSKSAKAFGTEWYVPSRIWLCHLPPLSSSPQG